jgi:esterase/lipase superfamily enzyme
MQKTDYIKNPNRILRMVLLVSLSAAFGSNVYGQTQTAPTNSGSTKARTEDGALRQIPFITLRNKTGSDEAADYFGDERSTTVHAGYCNVSRTEITSLQSIAKNAPFYIPDSIVVLDSIVEKPIGQLWGDLEETATGRRPILYTHGYYIDFDRGCKRASLFRESLGLADRFLFFSWPSDDAILNYTRDESDLYWSVAPLTGILTDMVGRFGAGGFDIAAHSLGTRGVFLALVQLAGEERPAGPLINQLVLLAPDIDAAIFKQHLSRIRPLARNITVYVSANDKPLAFSRQLHGHPRLGESGPHLKGLTGVEIIDVSEIRVRYPSGHVYHLYHNVVINDLAQILNEGKPASQRTNLKRTGENRWLLEP